MYYINVKQLELINRVHRLWYQHSEWTRMAFVSIIFKNPDEEAVISRLLRNSADFGYLLREFYGEASAFRFRDLLTEHLNLAGELVKAAMARDTIKAEKINRRLYENADEISALLGSINPFWQFENWRKMLHMHLDLAKTMASEMINGNYKESIDTYDSFESEITVMADIMAGGIIKNFPYLFHYPS